MLNDRHTDQQREQHHRHHRRAPNRRRAERLGIDPVGHQVGAPCGPPPVNAYTVSKTWAALMIPVTVTKNSVGRSIGSVMRRNRCHAVAPSVRAALWMSYGIARMPARKNSVT